MEIRLKEKNIDKQIGVNIRILRYKMNMSQDQLANLVGYTRPQITRIENGNHSPKIGVLYKIAEVFNVNISAILPQRKER